MERLRELSTTRLQTLLSSGKRSVVLLPVGSVEPHGPHLPLGTDTIISEGAAVRAAPALEAEGLLVLLAPSVPFGVTNYAEGFAGAISVAGDALTAFLRAVVQGFLRAGFSHVCLINNHLEPEHDLAVRATLEGLPRGAASVACPLTRRWARTLSAEFKSGACHAGRYETSLVLAAEPALVDRTAAAALPARTESLSDGIKAGKTRFLEMGLERAYTGAPAEASEAEGEALLASLAAMITAEVMEALASATHV